MLPGRLFQLVYFRMYDLDSSKCNLIDLMHNLVSSSAKKVFKYCIEKGILNNDNLKETD